MILSIVGEKRIYPEELWVKGALHPQSWCITGRAAAKTQYIQKGQLRKPRCPLPVAFTTKSRQKDSFSMPYLHEKKYFLRIIYVFYFTLYIWLKYVKHDSNIRYVRLVEQVKVRPFNVMLEGRPRHVPFGLFGLASSTSRDLFPTSRITDMAMQWHC